ncbi:MAG: Ig-like domain-containing protein, partial [Armatimonadota bacterium]
HYGSPIITRNTVRSNTAVSGGGIFTWEGSPTLTGNVINNNSATQHAGGVDLWVGSPVFVNNTVTSNTASYCGGLLVDQATATVRNNIVAFSAGGGGVRFYLCTITIAYCDVYSNTGGNYYDTTDQTGKNGNLSVDPLFANAAGGDFHEKAIAGRWNGSAWVNDTVVSPCIDAGDPVSSYANEPAPNGGRVNMGAYGNTAYASKSGSVLPTAPTIASATFVDLTHVNLTFSKALNAATVGAVGNYSVSPSLAVSAATLDADTKTVHLTTATQTLSATYTVTVSGVKDTLGNAVVAGSGDTASWTPSAIAPTIIAALPTGTHESAANPIITAAFSTAMNKPTAQGALSITPAQSGAAAPGWPGAFTWVGNQMQYKPSTALAPNTTYTVTINTTAQSSGGARLAVAKVWSFTTSGAPAVAACTPTGTAVPVGSNLTLTFNTSMLRTSVNGALTINGVKASIFGGRFTWVGSKLTFNPTKNLAASTSYKVVIGTGAKSAAGANMAKACNWTFKTKPAAAPTLTLTAATGLPVGSGVAFPISLSADASVGVEILSLAGRVVGTIPARECVAGTTTLTWNGRGAYGTASPAGAYLCHVNAFGKDGSRANALSRFVLRR